MCPSYLLQPATSRLDEALLNQEWDAAEAMLEHPASPDSLQSRGKAAKAAGAVAASSNPAIQDGGSSGGAAGHGRDPDDYSSGGGYYGPEPSDHDHSYGPPERSGDDHSYGRPGRSADDRSYGRPGCAAHELRDQDDHSCGRPARSADDTSPDYSSVSSVDGGYSGADSASSVGNGIRTGSGGFSTGGSSSGRCSSSGGSHVDEAAADSGFAPVAPAQRRVEGEEQGRGAGSEAEMSHRVTVKEEASRFLADLGLSFAVEASGAETGVSQGVGAVPMGPSPSRPLLQAGNNLHEGWRQVNAECDDLVANADMEDEYGDDELEDYVDTTPISWAPTLPAFLAPAATGLPFLTQHAALGMPPIPPPPPKPAGFPAAAESGSAHQPRKHQKMPSRGGQKRRHQESFEGGKRLKVSGGAARTAQQGSAQPPTLEGLSGGTASAEQQDSAPANAMQETAALGTDVAAAKAAGGEASTAQQGSGPAPTVGWGGAWNPRPSRLDAVADAMRERTVMLQQQQQQMVRPSR